MPLEIERTMERFLKLKPFAKCAFARFTATSAWHEPSPAWNHYIIAPHGTALHLSKEKCFHLMQILISYVDCFTHLLKHAVYFQKPKKDFQFAYVRLAQAIAGNESIWSHNWIALRLGLISPGVKTCFDADFEELRWLFHTLAENMLFTYRNRKKISTYTLSLIKSTTCSPETCFCYIFLQRWRYFKTNRACIDVTRVCIDADCY